jgi:hypothetical protein
MLLFLNANFLCQLHSVVLNEISQSFQRAQSQGRCRWGSARGVAPGYINIAPLGLAWGGAPPDNRRDHINIAPLGLC